MIEKNPKSEATNEDAFDEYWRSSYEVLGNDPSPPYVRASYYSEEFFAQREAFLKHLIDDLRDRMNLSQENLPLCLDIGCNIGLYTKMLHALDYKVYGFDYSLSLVQEAKVNHRSISFVQANAYTIPFKANVFDSVISFGVLQCVSEWELVLREIHRILKPTGLGIIETNSAIKFPLIEKVVRHTIQLIKRRMNPPHVPQKARQHVRQSSPSFAPRNFKAKDIADSLLSLGIDNIVIHDPAKYVDAKIRSVGFVFSKGESGENTARDGSINQCPLCRKRNNRFFK